MAHNICFKNLHDKSCEDKIFTRCVKDENSWRFAHRWEVPQEDLTFIDDDKNQHTVNEIFEIGVNDNSLFVYIYNTNDNNLEPAERPDNRIVKVSDKNEIAKLLNYLENNKCNKGC